MLLVSTLFYGSVIFWCLTEVWIGLREKGSARTGEDNYSRIVIVFCVSFAVSLSVILARRTYLPIFSNGVVYFLAGTIIILAGVIFRIWSVRTLGKFFRTTVMVQEKQQVISHGPYKYVRHPSYSGALLATFGVGVGTNNWVALVVLLLIIFIGLRYRMNIEEKVLSKELGKGYQEYMKHTKRIIPFVY